ncbi:MAG: alkaline phosphatase family protein [Thermoprotei archaeon]|nr:alkaline phosphatase family protein [Thermoprotei archaeon]
MSKRVFILGLDAMSPKIVERFVKEGSLPNFKKLMENGAFSKALPAIPAQTPENWTTIATGTWPGTHGITMWGRHDYGEPVTERKADEAMSSNLCRAEYLWEAAGRQGLRSVVFYFVGYPPTTDKAVHVDWFWRPGDYYFEICRAACYLNYIPERVKAVIKRGRRTLRGMASLVEFKRAEGWINLPESKSPPLEAEISIEPKFEGKAITYYVLLLDTQGKGYDTCLIAKEKDGKKALCTLRPGEWSNWFEEEFEIEGTKKIGTVRFKLIELSEDGTRFRLYRSQVYPVYGFTHPPELSKELVDKFGPYVNEAITKFFLVGLVDEKTWVEEMEYQITWISRAAKYLMDKYDASIFIMHWHLLDTLQHFVLALADPEGGIEDEAMRKEGMRLLRLGYQIADKLVGEFLKFVDDRTYLVVVSDHGNVPDRKRYSIVKALAEKGLVCVEKGPDGREVVNWAKSKVFVDLTNVYVNLKSRYANGVVDDSEYEEVRRQVIDALRSCKDQDGEYAVLFALKREDAPLVGLWGPHAGDVVFVYSQGFTWGTEGFEPGSVKVVGAHHGPQPPTAETELASNYAGLFIIGPGIKKGYVRPLEFMGPTQLVDVAPTVSYLLGIKPPKHSQGRILYDFLEGWDVSEMKRERKPLKFPKALTPIKGDVTDLV